MPDQGYSPKVATKGKKKEPDDDEDSGSDDCCDPESDAYDPEECRAQKAKSKGKKAKDGDPYLDEIARVEDARHHFDAKLILDRGGIRQTADGYLVASARVARTGIQLYGGHEVGDEAGRAQVRVYRPESEVFDNASLHTFAHKPVTLHHPKNFVNSGNWKQHAVGHVDGEIMRDGDSVRIPMLIMDSDAIRAVREGVQELSVGYDAALDWTPGVTDSGEEYDATQKGIRVNHIALTPVARGGPQLRIGDEDMADREVMTRQLVCDGITITLPNQDAQIVQRALARAQADATTAQEALAPAQAEVVKLTKDNQTLAGKVAALEQQVKDATVTDADLDKRVTERQALIGQAKRVLGETYKADGKSSNDIRRDAVTLKLGDAKARSLSDTAIEGAFEAITSDVKDGLGIRELGNQLSKPGNPPAGSREDVERAWEERGKQMREAWKTNNGSQVQRN